MAAYRYTLRLYRRSAREAQWNTNLDPNDDDALRDRLDAAVEKARGSLNVNLSEWRLVVHSLGGGRVRATCRVSGSGNTEVTR